MELLTFPVGFHFVQKHTKFAFTAYYIKLFHL
jgi:hypothetical protein